MATTHKTALVSSWWYFDNEKVVQNNKHKVSTDNFLRFSKSNYAPVFSTDTMEDSICIAPFLCYGLAMLVHNAIYKDKNEDTQRLVQNFYRKEPTKSIKELFRILSYFDNKSNFSCGKELYVFLNIHQTIPIKYVDNYKKLVSFLFIQFCCDKNSFVRICTDLLNSIFPNVPKYLNDFVELNKFDRFSNIKYELPNKKDYLFIFNDFEFSYLVTLRWIIEFYIRNDYKNANVSNVLDKLETIKTNIDFCISTLMDSENLYSVVFDYFKNGTVSIVENRNSEMYQLYQLPSNYTKVAYLKDTNYALARDAFEELNYCKTLCTTSLKYKHTRLFTQPTLVNYIMGMPFVISLFNDMEVKKKEVKSEETKLLQKVSEENRRLNNEKNELSSELTKTLEDIGKTIAKKDFDIQNKALQLQSAYAEIEAYKQKIHNLEKQIELLSVSKETETDEEINLPDIESMVSYLNNYRLAFLGGFDNLTNKLKDLGMTNFCQMDNLAEIGGNFDFICVMTRFCSHSAVCKILSENAREKIFYFNGTNTTLLINQCFEYIIELGGTK